MRGRCCGASGLRGESGSFAGAVRVFSLFECVRCGGGSVVSSTGGDGVVPGLRDGLCGAWGFMEVTEEGLRAMYRRWVSGVVVLARGLGRVGV